MTQQPVRQRRGLVGSTNLATRPRDCDNGQPASCTPTRPGNAMATTAAANPAAPRGEGAPTRRKRRSAGTGAGRDGAHLGSGAAGAGDDGGGINGEANGRHARHDRFRLPLVSSFGSCGASTSAAPSAPGAGPKGEAARTAEAQLARNIDDYERRSKSFKDEPWYKSPIGGGSKRSVLLVALQQRDPTACGRIRRADFEDALSGAIFALEPGHIRDLLAGCKANDPSAMVDYRQFVEKLELPTEQPERDPLIYRQQSYIEKVRARSHALLQQASPSPPPPSLLLPLVSPVQTGPPKDAIKGDAGRDEAANLLTVLPPLISPLRASPEPPSPNRDPETDRLSFEFDKQRKQRRADAKARTLLAHLHRVDEYSRQQQQLAESHESLRLATKAMHRQEHFERAFEEENRALRVVQRQGKGGLRSEYSSMQRNVSSNSMFSVEPTA